MPWLTRVHECKKPTWSLRRRPPGSLWRCPKCDIYYTVSSSVEHWAYIKYYVLRFTTEDRVFGPHEEYGA